MPSAPPIPRSSGILLHVTSLPGEYGIGDLGPQAYRWIDQLAAAGQRWWQVLPLGPAGNGNSPYQSASAFAGNELLISPLLLVTEGLLRRSDLPQPDFPSDRVPFGPVARLRRRLLDRAWERFRGGAARPLRNALSAFRKKESPWLDDYTLFMALKERFGEKPWQEWPAPLARRDHAALREIRGEMADTIARHRFIQFLFHHQLRMLRQHARKKEVQLIGDLPIFVSADSADTWAHPHLFLLDRDGRPRFVAGVPPDYFSATGQRWGNPLYDWPAMEREHFAWWIQRARALLQQVDLIRIDHFRGFAAAWHIPASAPTARSGRWIKAPGHALFAALRKALQGLPFIAEDLGEITPDVDALRQGLGLPGMRVLQFAFSDPANPFLPHNFERNTVVYTGTHDNDTTASWYRSLSTEEKARVRRYVPHADGRTIAWELVRLAWMSVADLAIAPLQDLLGLGSRARMNVPGKGQGNWQWKGRLLDDEAVGRLRELTEASARAGSASSQRGR